jgi:hypothetical protein
MLNTIEACNECGRDVSRTSGWFVNRVPDLNTIKERIEMNKAFPQGDFICAECDTKRDKNHADND